MTRTAALAAQRAASQALFLEMHAVLKRRAAVRPAAIHSPDRAIADIARTIGG